MTVVIIIIKLGIPIRFRPQVYRDPSHSGSYGLELASVLKLSFSLFTIFIVSLWLFWKKRNHHLINYRPVMLCLMTGIFSAFYNTLLPIITYFTENKDSSNRNSYICIIPLVFTIVFAPTSLMANLSRFIKIYLLNRRDFVRLKLYNKNNSNAFNMNESEGGERSLEPNTYLKRLNKLVSKQITIGVFLVPYIFLILLGGTIIAFEFYKEKDCSKTSNQGSECGVCNQGIILYSPIMLLIAAVSFIIPYMFIDLYSTVNIISKLDIVVNFIGIFLGSILFVSSLFVILDKDKLKSQDYKASEKGEVVKYYLFSQFRNNSLFFLIPSFVAFFWAIIVPLIEVYVSDFKLKNKKLLGKKEFTRLLVSSRYIDSLKSIAVKSYCVELVIFWESHMKLMKRIYDEVIKDQMEDGKIIGEEGQFPFNKDQKSISRESTTLSNYSYPNNSIANRNANSNYNPNLSSNSKTNSNTNFNFNSNSNFSYDSNSSLNSSLQPNYDLLLGLNKNIFGSDNDRIIYTGCYSNSGINPNLINYVIRENEEKEKEKDIYSSSPMGNTTLVNNRNRGFSLDDVHQPTRSNSNSNSNIQINMNNMNYGKGGSYGKGNYGSNGGMGNDNSTTSHSSYSSQNQMYSNNDKAGLLYRSDSNVSYGQNSTSSTLGGGNRYNSSVNNSMSMSYNSFSKNSNKRKANSNFNSNTEIFYEIFNVNPYHVVLPPKYWSGYNQLYHAFISEKSLATVNINDSTANKLNRGIKIRNYTIDMFFPAIAETVDLIYQNLYPKLVK
jgi:hypothetical protein